jgi:hypothetical protein
MTNRRRRRAKRKNRPLLIEAMNRHVAALTADIQVRPIRELFQAEAHFDKDEIVELRLPPVRSILSYATALHEIGHWKSCHGSSHNIMVRERWAWRWARENALIWTPAMERLEKKSLAIHANPERAWKQMTAHKRITALRRTAKQLRNNTEEAVTIKPEFREELARMFKDHADRIERRRRRSKRKHPRT